MLSIAGIMGAGLFVGSGHAIAAAGPAAILAYVFSGILVVLVMRMLYSLGRRGEAPGMMKVTSKKGRRAQGCDHRQQRAGRRHCRALLLCAGGVV
jgi:L-asparagine transporter-like permease